MLIVPGPLFMELKRRFLMNKYNLGYKKLFSLEEKVAVITGGAGVLCSSIAEGLGKAGAKVAICDISDNKNTVERLKDKKIDAKGYYIDVLSKEEINNCKNKILKDYGKINILVNGAGGCLKDSTTSEKLSFFDLPSEALQKVVMVNLFGGAIFPSQVFGKEMIKNKEEGSSIINISSMNAYRPLTRIPGYAAAKAAVSNFTQWLAVDLAQNYSKKIRVNAIAPGFFLTPTSEYLWFDEDGKYTNRAKTILKNTPMGEFGKPKDLIGTCIWLSSEASRFVTGAIIPIDGGFNAYAGV